MIIGYWQLLLRMCEKAQKQANGTIEDGDKQLQVANYRFQHIWKTLMNIG